MQAINQNITRRTALAAGAAALIPATAIPALALASGPDPVFGAIDNYKAACVYRSECLDRAEILDQKIAEMAEAVADREAPADIPARGRYNAVRLNPPANATPDDEPHWIAWRKAQDAYCSSPHNAARISALKELETHPLAVESEQIQDAGLEAEHAATLALLQCVPTTKAGALALIAFATAPEREAEGFNDYTAESETEPGTWERTYPPAIILANVGEYLSAIVVQS